VHETEQISLVRTIIVEVIVLMSAFVFSFIVIISLIISPCVVSGVIRISTRGSWYGSNQAARVAGGITSSTGGEGRFCGDLSSPSESPSRITPSPRSMK
jgi:hypothetical protein